MKQSPRKINAKTILVSKRSCSNIDLTKASSNKFGKNRKSNKSRNFYTAGTFLKPFKKEIGSSSRKKNCSINLPQSSAQTNYVSKAYKNSIVHKPPGFETLRNKGFRTVTDWRRAWEEKLDGDTGSNESSSKRSLTPVYT